ncbi:biotin-independent malonate decarboxylase subunit gamma [Acetobacter conturbans]|uniref:Biotin-independent malonate decarboxylase subunit gamma n=1 Tax=Acetobacter conturbans TaxID=1737472 RepID=A0ABX0K745_9PROT|nr:biotin-independent malonate decarboxylase subunit gamma [Acetobacter conturbans]NHN89752.1 biotin-independent malonate decarboxylase subunit gamma [Acetobacter conturbans]
MTPDDLLASLFPKKHAVVAGPHNTLSGTATLDDDQTVEVLGITGGTPLSPEIAIQLAGRVLEIINSGSKTPIVFLLDTASQRMTRRDEMLGLNEYLAHLAKVIVLAGTIGHRTVGILYGTAAAGAFIATALATQTLITVDGALPSVMDLPSIARVTKLPLEVLQQKAETTPIFSPGVPALAATGAVFETWPSDRTDFPERLKSILTTNDGQTDLRDRLGEKRGGRKVARDIAQRVAMAFSQVDR